MEASGAAVPAAITAIGALKDLGFRAPEQDGLLRLEGGKNCRAEGPGAIGAHIHAGSRRAAGFRIQVSVRLSRMLIAPCGRRKVRG